MPSRVRSRGSRLCGALLGAVAAGLCASSIADALGHLTAAVPRAFATPAVRDRRLRREPHGVAVPRGPSYLVPARVALDAATTSLSRTVLAAATEEKLDKILRERLDKQQGDEDEEEEEEQLAPKKKVKLSSSAQQAIDAVTGEGEKKAKRKKKKKAKAAAEAHKKASKSLVRQSLDEVLSATSEESMLPARVDIYEEVGITEEEVDAYWLQREEQSTAFWEGVSVPIYPIIFLSVCAFAWSVYDSNVDPQKEEELIASPAGLSEQTDVYKNPFSLGS